MRFVDRGALAAGERDALAAELADAALLEQVLRWGHGRTPPFEVAAVITQDEYSHDVVMRWTGGRFLVFDTT